MPFFTTDDGVRLHYRTDGNGAALVLIHGLTASSRYFQKQIPFLARHYKIVTPDLRGHGDSATRDDHLTLPRLAQDLRQLLEELHIEKASFIGWSMGAHVIFEYIKNYSCKNIEKIVIVEMTPKLLKAADWSCGLPGVFSRKQGDFGQEDNLFMLSLMLDNWEAYSKVVAQRILNKSLYNDKMEFNAALHFKGKEDLPWLYEESAKNKAWVIAAFWIAMSLADYRPVLKMIDVPCLLAYGMESNYYPPENYEFMQRQLPNAMVVPFAGCGHALHIQDPELFNNTVMNFLQ